MSFSVNFHKKRFRHHLISLIISLLFSACISTEYNVGTHREDIFLYSTEREVNIGRAIARQVEKQLKISHDPEYVKRVNRIGEKIASVCDRQEIHYYFYVIDEDIKNAFSLPGGYVYVYKGLMDILNDDELAFVVGHEVGHIVLRHAIKKLQAAMGMNLLVLASTRAETGPDFAEGLSFALAQIMVAYSRQDEFEADELGAKYTKLAGFNPESGLSVLKKLYEEEKKAPLRPLSYFRTHPYPPQRIAHLKEYLGLPLDVTDYIN